MLFIGLKKSGLLTYCQPYFTCVSKLESSTVIALFSVCLECKFEGGRIDFEALCTVIPLIFTIITMFINPQNNHSIDVDLLHSYKLSAIN